MSNKIENILHQKKMKVTPIRLAILNTFSKNTCRPKNAEQVLAQVQKRDNSVNLVTIYRNLISFEESGILRRIDLHQKSIHYELTAHHHHHIVCQDCGEIESFENCDLGALDKKLLKQTKKFKQIKSHSLEFFGQCKSCFKK
jgi:Fur family ferric uptake transcriptional regulator